MKFCNFLFKNIVIIVTTLSLILFSNWVYAAVCNPADSSTVDKITACITLPNIQQHMQDVENLAVPDPALGGHLSRDGGTQGNINSVNYMKQKMLNAGYKVQVQTVPFLYSIELSPSVFQSTTPIAHDYVLGTDFSVSTFSGAGDVTAPLQAAGGISTTLGASVASGCSAADFAGFTPGNIALVERGTCANRDKVLNAIAAGAVGVISMNNVDLNEGNTLLSTDGMTVPVFAYIPFSIGINLYNQLQQGPVVVHMKANVLNENRTTYNVIADSPYGDLNNTVVLVAHLDSIYSEGMNDNASGSVAIMEIALAMKNTKTLNHMRYIWTGAEEENLDGALYYVGNLKSNELKQIAFVLDADVIATTNYIISVQSLKNTNYEGLSSYSNTKPKASGSGVLQTQVINASQLGTDLFNKYFNSIGLHTVDSSRFTNCGSDGCVFGVAGIPWTNAYTGQTSDGGGKTAADVALFGGTVGPFELCIDTPYVYCDNLSNINYNIMLPVTKAYAAVAVQLAYTKNLKSLSQDAVNSNDFKSKHINWTSRNNSP